MGPPAKPFQPYAAVHVDTKGPGDARPTALQVVEDCNLLEKFKGKTILITGCTAGIGIETARALYETGAKLLLTARDMTKAEQVIEKIVNESPSKSKGFPRPEAVEIHLNSLASVRKGAETIKGKTKELNILITNAGIMAVPFQKTEDGFESQVGTNHFAHFLLFSLLKPLLTLGAKQSGTPSRVITVSSAGHRMSGILFDDMNFEKSEYNKFVAYGQSKTANVYMANAIDRKYRSQGIVGLSLHPGVIATELGRYMPEEEVASLWKGVPQGAAKSIEQGAATTVWAAVSPHFEETGHGGQYLADVGECGPMAGDPKAGAVGYASHAYDEEKEERLWKISCEAVGVAEA